jgi:competence protein ComEC
MRRPLVIIALLYAGGILVGNLFAVPPVILVSAALGLAVATSLWSSARAWLLYPLMFFAGWSCFAVSTAVIFPKDLRRILGTHPQIATLRGLLTETPSVRFHERGDRTTIRTLAHVRVSAIQLQHQDWEPATGLIVVGTAGTTSNLFGGQTVEITGAASRPKPALAEGLFDYRSYLERLGIFYELQASSEQDWQIISSPAKPPLADRFREWGKRALARGLPCEDEALRLEWALTLGWKPALTEEVSEPFIRAATYHIFAVDGLRMAIVFGIVFGLLRVLGVPRAAAGVVLLPLIWFYVALTGWPASAIRATVMLTIIIFSWALKRPTDLINSLFAAALIILIWQPQQLFQAGFQLSFFVVLCLVLTVPILQDLTKRALAPDPLLAPHLRRQWPVLAVKAAHFFRDTLLTSFAAWVGALPLVAYYFHIVTPVSTPANLLAVPLCGFVLASNLASLLLAGWLPAGAELFNHAGWALMQCIRISSEWFAELPTAYYYVSAPALFTTCLYYFALLALVTGWLFAQPGRNWKIILLGIAIACWLGQAWHQSTLTTIRILPANGAAAIYFDAPGVKNDVLIDCGNENYVESVTKTFLRSQGVNRLSNLLLTQSDVRHMGGMQTIQELFKVKHIWASPVRFRSPAHRQILNAFNDTPEKMKTLQQGDRLNSWRILYPEADRHLPKADDNALVMLGVFGTTRVLLLSDLGPAGQRALLDDTQDMRADIVVSGLPTNGEPLSDAMLDAIQPRVIVVTDAEFPARERAKPKLRERLNKRNIPVLYTSSCGAVTLQLGKLNWTIRAMDGALVTSQNPGLQTGPRPEN